MKTYLDRTRRVLRVALPAVLAGTLAAYAQDTNVVNLAAEAEQTFQTVMPYGLRILGTLLALGVGLAAWRAWKGRGK